MSQPHIAYRNVKFEALDDLCIMTITSGDICTKPQILSLKSYHGGKSLQAFYIMLVICVKILTFGPLGKAINLSNDDRRDRRRIDGLFAWKRPQITIF